MEGVVEDVTLSVPLDGIVGYACEGRWPTRSRSSSR
jgi:hypothetical protein